MTLTFLCPWPLSKLDVITLVLKFDPVIIKMYVCTKNEVPTFNGSKVIIWTNTQTDRQMDRQTDTHTDTQTDRHTHRHTDRQTWLKLLPTTYADGKYGSVLYGIQDLAFPWTWKGSKFLFSGHGFLALYIHDIGYLSHIVVYYLEIIVWAYVDRAWKRQKELLSIFQVLSIP